MGNEFKIRITDMPESCRVCSFFDTDFSEEHKCLLIKFINRCTDEYSNPMVDTGRSAEGEHTDYMIGDYKNTEYFRRNRYQGCPLDKKKGEE